MEETQGTYRKRDSLPDPMEDVMSSEAEDLPDPPTHSKMMAMSVTLLDESQNEFSLPSKSTGKTLLNQVCHHLNLIESDYFGLLFMDSMGNEVWLDPLKPICNQVKKDKKSHFSFAVKFFPPDPSQLQEEITRYQFALQVRHDLAAGKLVGGDTAAAVMAACLLQADVGDFEEEMDRQHVATVTYFPTQNDVVEKLLNFHKNLLEMSPMQAESRLLDMARRQDLYGVRLYAAHDKEGTSIRLAVTHSGIAVFQNTTKINNFNWSKIRKLSFKRRCFLIKFHPDEEGCNRDALEFQLASRDACKAFWKACVETHGFFRLHDPPPARPKRVLLSRGSTFHYSGRTQKQLSFRVKDVGSRTVKFERRNSKLRASRRSLPSQDSPRGARMPQMSASFSCADGLRPHFVGPSSRVEHSNIVAESPKKSPFVLENGVGASCEADNGDGPPPIAGDKWLINEDILQSPSGEAHVPFVCIDENEAKPACGLASGTEAGGDANFRPEAPHSQRAAGGLSITEEFIDDDPADVSFYGGCLSLDTAPNDATNADGSFFSGDDDMAVQTLHIEQKASNDDDAAGAITSLDASPSGSLVASTPNAARVSDRSQSDVSPVVDGRQQNGQSYGHSDSSSSSLSGSPEGTLMTEAMEEMFWVSSPQFCWDPLSQNREVHLLENVRNVEAKGTGRPSQPTCQTEVLLNMIKELCATERTHIKNLEVLTLWFRNFIGQEKESVLPEALEIRLFGNLEPLHAFHCAFLKELERRLALWSGRSVCRTKAEQHRVGDVLLRNMHLFKPLTESLVEQETMVVALIRAQDESSCLESLCHNFEMQRVCYLPLLTFLAQPLHRPFQYRRLLTCLCRNLSQDSPDQRDCCAALGEVTDVTSRLEGVLVHLENTLKLMELRRDLDGVGELSAPGREFIREGCLFKLSSKGMQQRMFFLFSDVLLYSKDKLTSSNRFRVCRRLRLADMKIKGSDLESSIPHCVTLETSDVALVVASTSRAELDKWLKDLDVAIRKASISSATSADDDVICKNGRSSSDDENETTRAGSRDDKERNMEFEEEESGGRPESSRTWCLEGSGDFRPSSTAYVCWHRGTSVAALDLGRTVENLLSGYLLRKFKNSSGWQKLWVVFTNLCLFFYKTYQDDFPLASLPLLGYTITTPTVSDRINKDFVFKLQFKSHVYFFRAEGRYTFNRWMEVIKSVTCPPSRTSLLGHKHS
uniref:FERM, ARHGEF and pleckstrin domain-containing protein 1-like isoform X1 n=2 Tax=Myxine glutinosa TaxID=7769 RepID=UPI00358F176B